jgi:hypothetical protein
VTNPKPHPKLLSIYINLIERFQILAKKIDNERNAIYMDDLLRVSKKIKFIQMFTYYGIDAVICRFKQFKNNHREFDPEITEIKLEPNEFQDESYKELIYKLYLLCISDESFKTVDIYYLNLEYRAKVYFLNHVIINYKDIQHIISNYLLPIGSCIKQDKLKTICCEEILSYLQPPCITERYIVMKINRILQL